MNSTLPIINFRRRGGRNRHIAEHSVPELDLDIRIEVIKDEFSCYNVVITTAEGKQLRKASLYCPFARVRFLLREEVRDIVDERRIELRTSCAVSAARIGLINI